MTSSIGRVAFDFGENWSRFLNAVDEDRIERAAEGLRDKLEISTLEGKSFLDAGSGSGLFSLAARRLGARVHSFDYDPKSVACTQELKRRYSPEDARWTIEQGSVLDRGYLTSLGDFDVVYSWGVLHHTGDMWAALENILSSMHRKGTLFIAIYNDQGHWSRGWTYLKRTYVRSPRLVQQCLAGLCLVRVWGPALLLDMVRGRGVARWCDYRQTRGMSPWYDVVDWVGGYPFEVAKPEDIFDFYRRRGLALKRLATCGGGKGCNEFVFERA